MPLTNHQYRRLNILRSTGRVLNFIFMTSRHFPEFVFLCQLILPFYFTLFLVRKKSETVSALNRLLLRAEFVLGKVTRLIKCQSLGEKTKDNCHV